MKNVILLLLVSLLSTALQSADTKPVNFPEKKWEIKDIDLIKQMIKNGVVIKTIYDGFGREMPPLIYFCNCVNAKENDNAFHPLNKNDIFNEGSFQRFDLDLDIIEKLLKQKANPLYQTKLHTVDDPTCSFYWMAYSLQSKDFKVKSNFLDNAQNNALNVLLEKYNGSNTDTKNPYLSSEKETTQNKMFCVIS